MVTAPHGWSSENCCDDYEGVDSDTKFSWEALTTSDEGSSLETSNST